MERETEKMLKQAVREEVSARLGQGSADQDEVKRQVRDAVADLASLYGVLLDGIDTSRLVTALIDDFLYYGPLQPLLEDDSITEIMVNGGGVDVDDPALPFRAPIVYVERAGRIEARADVAFDDAQHVRRIINRIAEQAGCRCDEVHAMGCAMLPGGRARATFVVPPIAPDGPSLNIRTYKSTLMGMQDLEAAGALSYAMSDFLRSAVAARCPVVISGGTGSGKTTLLNALSGFVFPDERVITIEDTPELHLLSAHVERMQTRDANVEGEGAVTMRDLVEISLRRRPDRIMIGECRGAEAYDMLQAMQTDHPGSMTTIHANDPDNALSRLQTMVGYASSDLGQEVIVRQIAESLQGGLIVHAERLRDGRRKVTSIVAVDALPAGSLVIPRVELFAYERGAGEGESPGRGLWRGLGVQPQRIKQKIQAAGLLYEPEWFFDKQEESR